MLNGKVRLPLLTAEALAPVRRQQQTHLPSLSDAEAGPSPTSTEAWHLETTVLAHRMWPLLVRPQASANLWRLVHLNGTHSECLPVQPAS